MYAVFGDIVFESAAASPEKFRSRRKTRFAEDRVIEATARLQWTGDEPERLEVEMLLHVSAGGQPPAIRLLLLEGALADHLARPLVYGNGTYRGLFVLGAMDTSDIARADDGSLIAARVRATLLESALDTAGLAAAAMSALGIAPPGVGPGVVSGLAPAPGLSALGTNGVSAAPAASLLAGDVLPSAIVRA